MTVRGRRAGEGGDLGAGGTINGHRLARARLVHQGGIQSFRQVAAFDVEHGRDAQAQGVGNRGGMLLTMQEIEHPCAGLRACRRAATADEGMNRVKLVVSQLDWLCCSCHARTIPHDRGLIKQLTFRCTSLRVGFARNRGIITSAYLALQSTGLLTPEYIYLVLNAYDLMKIFYGMGSGLRQNLDFADLKRMPIVVPPPDEQAAIVRFLDHADRRIRRYIAAKRKLIALLNEQKQAVIYQAVTRGLNPNVTRKPSGAAWLGDVPEHWEVVGLGMRYSVRLGKMLDAKQITGNYLVPYLRNTDVQWDHINVDNLPMMDVQPSEYERYLVKPGDMLVCEGGDVGRSAFWIGALAVCAFQKALHRVRPYRSERDYPRFLYYVMKTVSKLGVFLADGSENTIAHLTGEKFRRYRFPFPPYLEQQEIANYLDRETQRCDRAIDRAQREIELIREYRTRLITDVVTGKLDVRSAAAELSTESNEPLPTDDEFMGGQIRDGVNGSTK